MEVLLVPADLDHPTGPEVVHKSTSVPQERERLLREAVMLQLAADRRVPGLATVVAPPSADAAAPTLVTSAAPGPSLAVAAPLPVLEIAGVAAEVARLLAGLHQARLVHGAVEPGHVVLDAGGVILVGLGRGGEIGSLPVDSPGAAAYRLDPAADIAGWGALVAHLLDWSELGEEEPMLALRRSIIARPNRGKKERQAVRGDDDDRRTLAALADQAQDPDPTRRPSARSLAATIAHRIPNARMPGVGEAPPVVHAVPGGLLGRLSGHLATPLAKSDVGATAIAPDDDIALPREGRPRSSGGRRGRSVDRSSDRTASRSGRPDPVVRLILPTFAGAPARDRLPGIVNDATGGDPADPGPEASGVGPVTVDRRTRRSGPDRRPRLSRLSPRCALAVAAVIGVLTVGGFALAGRVPGTPDIAPAATDSPAAACLAVVGPAADIDGDGCAEAVRWQDGVLQAGAARFALGAQGDGWAIGDWNCDGHPTPALLHEGALTVFDAWPGPDAELQGRVVARAASASDLSVVADAGGCDRPALRRPGALDLVVDPRKAP